MSTRASYSGRSCNGFESRARLLVGSNLLKRPGNAKASPRAEV